jgi:hypothetical protein
VSTDQLGSNVGSGLFIRILWLWLEKRIDGHHGWCPAIMEEEK